MKIIAAAIMKHHMIFTLPAPARHHAILHIMSGTFGIPQDSYTEQGFLTDTGNFVSRKAALIIAADAGQLEERVKTNPPYELFSEDLW
jgi:hypothetical protein